MMKKAAAAAIAVIGTVTMLGAQAKNAPAKNGVSTIMGCVQSAQGQGFVLLNPQGSPASNKTQTLTYKLQAGKDVDLSKFANKRVEVSGKLSPKPAGNVPAPVPDSVRGTGGAGGSGKPGVDNASAFANGVFAVQTIKEVSGTCAGDARE